VTGTYPVRGPKGVLVHHRIELELHDEYPDELPMVRELDRRIPRTTDRHVNPHDNTLCVVLPEEYWSTHENCELIAYLDGPVREFFISQLHFEHHKSWPFGHRNHGDEGLFDFFEELFGTRDQQAVRHFLDYLSRERIAGHWTCPCGSKQKLRKCHGPGIRDLYERLPQRFAVRALMNLDRAS